MNPFVKFIVVVALAYAVLCGLIYAVQDRLLFFPRSNNPQAVATLTGSEWSTHRAGAALHGWLVKAPTARRAPLVLYFGGNAQDVSLMATNGQYPEANYLYVNYRGYGSSEGAPTAWDLKADALHIYDTAVTEVDHNGNVLAHGRSLGSGVATYLAAHRPIAGLILVTPFDSVNHVARRYYPWLPVAQLLRHDFDSAALAPRLLQPALFLLAGRDRVIDPIHSELLANAWRGPIEILRFPAATHNSIGGSREFRARVADFVRRF